jgi:hypothetical protein
MELRAKGVVVCNGFVKRGYELCRYISDKNTMTHPLSRPELVSGSHRIKSMMCSGMHGLIRISVFTRVTPD